MRFGKKLLIFLLIFFSFHSVSAWAQDYEISQFKLKNIKVPSGFGVCTLDECDSTFTKLLKRFNHTYEDWIEQIMKPGSIYFYASDNRDRNIYIKCIDVFNEVQTEDDETIDTYMFDYNLAQTEEEQDRILKAYKKQLEENSIGTIDVEVEWLESDDESVTRYIVSSYRQSGLYVYEYNTIYAGIEWTYSISHTEKLSKKERQMIDNLVSEVVYGYDVDYTDSIMAVKSDDTKEESEEEEFYLDTKYGRIIFLSITIIAVVAIICIITDKQRNKYKNQ